MVRCPWVRNAQLMVPHNKLVAPTQVFEYTDSSDLMLGGALIAAWVHQVATGVGVSSLLAWPSASTITTGTPPTAPTKLAAARTTQLT